MRPILTRFPRLLIIGGGAALALIALRFAGCGRSSAKLPGGSAYTTMLRFSAINITPWNPPLNTPSGVIPGPDGNLYGLLGEGGREGGGGLYRFDPGINTYTTITQFGKDHGSSTPVFGKDGFLYGLISGDRKANKAGLYRCDIKTGQYKILAAYDSAEISGISLVDSVLMGSDGSLYGVTRDGGTGKVEYGHDHGGTLFRVDPQAGTWTTLVNFGMDTTGNTMPDGALTQGRDGSLYGVTAFGGKGPYGTLYRYDPVKHTFATMINFMSADPPGSKPGEPSVGDSPCGELLPDNDGNLYGVTRHGGPSGFGALYRYNCATRAITALVQFGSATAVGQQPDGRLTWGRDGWLYGTTYDGGPGKVELYSTNGTLFRYNVRAKEYQTLVNFHTQEVPIEGPSGGVVMVADGTLWGAVTFGGTLMGGVLYRVTLP